MATTDMAQGSGLFSTIQDVDAQALQGGAQQQQIFPDVLVSRGFLGILLLNRLGTLPQYLISVLKPVMPK